MKGLLVPMVGVEGGAAGVAGENAGYRKNSQDPRNGWLSTDNQAQPLIRNLKLIGSVPPIIGGRNVTSLC